jgi:hypothetical protein
MSCLPPFVIFQELGLTSLFSPSTLLAYECTVKDEQMKLKGNNEMVNTRIGVVAKLLLSGLDNNSNVKKAVYTNLRLRRFCEANMQNEDEESGEPFNYHSFGLEFLKHSISGTSNSSISKANVSSIVPPFWPSAQGHSHDAITSLIFLVSQCVYSNFSLGRLKKAISQTGHGETKVVPDDGEHEMGNDDDNNEDVKITPPFLADTHDNDSTGKNATTEPTVSFLDANCDLVFRLVFSHTVVAFA